MAAKLVLTVAVSLLLQACTNIGPATVPRDRFDYNAAIADSWKQQTLLNIVKLRYADMPVFVEVASVVSGYQFEGALSVGGSASSTSSVQGDFLQFNTGGKYIDRPTITYQPITGSAFNRSFMTPIPPKAILFLMETGWAPELFFPLTVDSINGLRSQTGAGLNQRSGDSAYYRVVQLMAAMQQSGAVGMRVRKQGPEDLTVLFFYQDALEGRMREKMQEFFRLLNIDPEKRELSVVYGPVSRDPGEIAMTTLSMLQILVKLAGMVDVPAEDVESGRTVPSFVSPETETQRRLIAIKQGVAEPDSAFVAIRYRDRWFWIEDTDFRSKRTFTFLMVLFSLTETGGRDDLPLVTIPAG